LLLAATHPIQYQIPWYRELAVIPGLDLEVGYAWLPDPDAQGTGFGVAFEWDLPLLEGYRWTELARAGGTPDLDRFAALRLRRPGRWLAGRPATLLVTGWHRLPLIQLAIAARRRRIPVLARGDSTGAGRRRLHRRLLLRAWLRLFAGFLVVGSRNREFYRELGIDDARIFDCPHFVDNRRFTAAAERALPRRAELRLRWRAADDSLVVLFCGKLIPEKNVGELLEAFATASTSAAGLRLVIVGDGPLRGELQAQAERLGVRAAWCGFQNQSQLPESYAAADLLVLPSRSETWGLVVNEAFASGLPVIASDRVGCVPDLVHPGKTGAVYRSGHPEELAARLLQAAANPAWLRRAGEEGRRLVLGSYSVERAVAGTLLALSSVVRAA
jgi:glycosyltransferase involved in cell wall biosynthesis